MVPPLFCVLLGFATVGLRPEAMLSWAFLGLMLSLSQLQLWPESYVGFQETANPMLWTDWLRVLAVGYRAFVQYAWPAALLAFTANLIGAGRGIRRAALFCATPFLVAAALQAVVQIGWSEDFRTFAPLYRFLGRYRSDFTVAALAGVVVLAWLLSRTSGLAVTVFASLAIGALFWGPPPITQVHWITYSDNTRNFEAIIPKFHHTPALVFLLFAAGCVLSCCMAFRRSMTWLEVAALLLLAPLTVLVAGGLGDYWFPMAPPVPDYVVWSTLAASGAGLVCIARSVVKRTS